MIRRHAAALALLGWYLTTPPIHKAKVVLSVPLSKWDIRSSYDSAEKCMADQTQMRKYLDSKCPTKAARGAESWALCIASDDSRLAKQDTPPVKLGHSGPN